MRKQVLQLPADMLAPLQDKTIPPVKRKELLKAAAIAYTERYNKEQRIVHDKLLKERDELFKQLIDSAYKDSKILGKVWDFPRWDGGRVVIYVSPDQEILAKYNKAYNESCNITYKKVEHVLQELTLAASEEEQTVKALLDNDEVKNQLVKTAEKLLAIVPLALREKSINV